MSVRFGSPHRRRVRLAFIQAALGACASPPPSMRLGSERIVEPAGGPSWDGVALVSAGADVAAIWSDPSGTWMRPLTSDGTARAERVRLAGRCDGGLDAVAVGRELRVACVRRGRPERGDEGAVSVVRASWSGGAFSVRRIASAGPQSRGVTIACDAEGACRLGWLDARPGDWGAWSVALEPGPSASPRRLSHPALPSGRPALLAASGLWLAAWQEWGLDRGRLVGEVRLEVDGGLTRSVERVLVPDAEPVLALTSRGIALAVRDERPAGSRPRLYVRRAGTAAELVTARSVRTVRADGPAGPLLLECAGRLVAIGPRRWSRGSGVIGLRELDAGLDAVGVERQIYLQGRDYAAVAATCVEGGLLVAFAERGDSYRQRVPLAVVPVRLH
ncbi:MAG: hypothetical protein NZ898_07640 [Myxococcota bacterium]|nr:hypothetical protein [Myxococcota bacterium]MDW8363028.1 hypothetical protein [Myxococcales bacterium]